MSPSFPLNARGNSALGQESLLIFQILTYTMVKETYIIQFGVLSTLLTKILVKLTYRYTNVSLYGNMLKISHLTQLLLFQICAHEIRERFVYKQSETIEYVQN